MANPDVHFDKHDQQNVIFFSQENLSSKNYAPACSEIDNLDSYLLFTHVRRDFRYKTRKSIRLNIGQNLMTFLLLNCHSAISDGRKCPIILVEFADHCKSIPADARKETE